jgi:branched-chain amino acid transport system substrate-binding protein
MSSLKKYLAAVLIIVVLFSLLGASCGGSSETPLGAFIGLTGNISVYAESQKKGIDLAVEEINQSGYLGKNKTLKVYFEDSGATSEGATAAIRKLIDRHVNGLIGPTLSSQAFAADPLAQKAGIPVIGISNTVPNIVEMGDYIFRCSLPESSVIFNTLKTAADKYSLKKISLLWGSDQDLTVAGHQAYLSAAGWFQIQVLDDLSYKTGESDFSSQLAQIISQHPDAIGVAALADDAVKIVVQMRALGYTGLVLGSNGFNSPVLIKQAGKAANDIIVGTAWNKDLEVAANQKFISSFEKKYSSSPDQFAAQSYTAVYLYAKALATAGKSDSAALRAALAGIRNLATPLGDFSFTDKREPVCASAVQIVRNGEFVILK